MLPVPPPAPPAAPRFLSPTSASSLCRPSPPPISATPTTAPAPLTSLEFRRYDFAPLLEFLSSSSSSASAASAAPLAQLDPAELRLAESYRAVPAHFWHALLKSLASSPSTLPSAAALVPWLERHRLCFSSDLLYSILIHALGRSRRLHHALLLSTSAPGPLSALTFNALISASAINGRPGQAFHLLSVMRRHGFLSDHPNYTLVLQSLLRSPDPPDPSLLLRLLSDLLSQRLEPDARLMSDFVVAFSRAGEPDRALSLLAAAQAQGLTPKTSAVVALLSSLGAAGRVAEAEALFLEFHAATELQPRTRAYNALLKGYVKIGALKDAELVFNEMERCSVSPDEGTYSLLIDAYSYAGRW